MRNRRISQKRRHVSYTQTLFIQKVFGVFHTLLLVKIKNSSAKNFFEPLFYITLIHGHFAAQFLDGNGVANMLQ